MTNSPMQENILINAINNPQIMKNFSAEEWNDCLREAKAAGVAGRLAQDAEDMGFSKELPAKVQVLFRSFLYNSAASKRKILWEMDRVLHALRGSDEKIILMKGATYIARGLKCATGRLSVDLDIMLAKNRIDWAEDKFLRAGWEHQVVNDYDQKFYREYSHELPPLVHPDRYISIDVHHNILPVTARVKPDVQKMIENAQKLENGFYTFSDTDILLHSIVHLFHDGEIRGSIRNLLEQHDLYNEFGKKEGFWDSLPKRAEELGLTRSLYYSLYFCQEVFGTDIPDIVFEKVEKYAPGAIAGNLMKWMVPGVISPSFGQEGLTRFISMNALYIRSHWLRMPFPLLVKHLTIKFFRGFSEESRAVE